MCGSDSTVNGRVAEVVLDRPDVLNSLDDAMVAEFHTVLDGAADARCVLVRGEGRGFSAGRDLSTAEPLTEDATAILGEVFNPLIARIAELPVPTIAAVHGACLGVGFGIAMACDLVYCAEKTKIGSPFANIGAVLDSGGHAALVGRVGPHRALELIYTGRLIDGNEAAAMGLVNGVVPDGELLDHVRSHRRRHRRRTDRHVRDVEAARPPHRRRAPVVRRRARRRGGRPGRRRRHPRLRRGHDRLPRKAPTEVLRPLISRGRARWAGGSAVAGPQREAEQREVPEPLVDACVPGSLEMSIAGRSGCGERGGGGQRPSDAATAGRLERRDELDVDVMVTDDRRRRADRLARQVAHPMAPARCGQGAFGEEAAGLERLQCRFGIAVHEGVLPVAGGRGVGDGADLEVVDRLVRAPWPGGRNMSGGWPTRPKSSWRRSGVGHAEKTRNEPPGRPP